MQQEKTALVTGGNSGIGLATVKKLLDQGLDVIAADRQLDRLADLAQIRHTLIPRLVDLTDATQLEQFCTELSQREPPVTVLVNNAGYSIRGMLEEVPLAEIKRIFEVNVFAVVRITQACLPGMRRVRQGRIVNISSIAGKFTFPGNGTYAATKHAVEAFTDALRHEVAPFGIQVVAIRPAFIATQFNSVANQMSSQFASSVSGDYQKIAETAKNSLNTMWKELKPIKPESVADLIIETILCDSPQAAYTIGPLSEDFLTQRARLDDDDWKVYMDEITGLTGLHL